MTHGIQITITRDSGSPTNFGGRFEYLSALESVWPEMLEALYSDVFSPSRAWWNRALKGSRGAIREVVNQAEAARWRGGRTSVKALARWAEKYYVIDEWMYDAALHTMHSWLSDVHERTRWHYYPCRLAPRRFEPEFGYWVPVDAGIGLRALTRNEFRKEATRQFHQQLEKYCRQVEAEWGVRKAECGQLALHARWTAQYKRGMSILEICTGLRRYRDPEQAVRKAIRRFKRAIGVH